MARRAGPLAEISPGDAEISASGLEKFSYKHAIPVTGLKIIILRMSSSLIKKNAAHKISVKTA